MPTLDDLVADYRAQLARREAERIREMVRAYHGVWQRIQPRLDELTAAIEAGQAAGDPTFSALYQRERLAMLQDEVIRELQRLTGRTYAQIIAEQRHAAELGTEAAQRFLREVLDVGGVFSTATVRLPRAAIEAIVAALSDGSPLRALLARLGPETWRQAEAALIEAVALGRNPRAIATALRRALDISRTRALTIARTEVLRAYRVSALDSYRQTSVIKGWVWMAAVTNEAANLTRVCAACWAMHGRWFPLDVPFESHPNCRCSAAPCLGFPDADGYYRGEPFGATGPERFASLPASVQREILGPGKYAAWLRGDIELPDLVSVRESGEWGITRSVASLAEAMENAANGREAA